jgi:alpha-aminoadipate carrier protein LysW
MTLKGDDKTMETVQCNSCDNPIVFDEDAIEGEVIVCPICGAEYEVKIEDGSPILVELVLEGEDWGE